MTFLVDLFLLLLETQLTLLLQTDSIAYKTLSKKYPVP